MCDASHFLKEGFCVTPLLSNRRQQASGLRSVSPLVIVITFAALFTIAFVLFITCHAMYCGHPLRSYCCLCCWPCRRVQKDDRASMSTEHPKGYYSTTSSVGDELTEEIQRSAKGATNSDPASPTCFMIDPFTPNSDLKASEGGLSREQLSHRVLMDPEIQLQSTNESMSFQTAHSKPSPARKRNSRARANAALSISDGDKSVSSSAWPDEVSVKLPVGSNASKPCTQSAALPGAHVTPTKGGKFRWSEVQQEASMKTSLSARVPERANTNKHGSAYEKVVTPEQSPQVHNSPGESCKALLNHWKRAREIYTRRAQSYASWTQNKGVAIFITNHTLCSLLFYCCISCCAHGYAAACCAHHALCCKSTVQLCWFLTKLAQYSCATNVY